MKNDWNVPRHGFCLLNYYIVNRAKLHLGKLGIEQSTFWVIYSPKNNEIWYCVLSEYKNIVKICGMQINEYLSEKAELETCISEKKNIISTLKKFKVLS